jgi:hypothetical protein
MPAFQEVLASPAKVTMLLLCIFATGFMVWFLGGLIAERSRAHARYIVRIKLGEGESAEAFPDQAGTEPFLDETPFEASQIDRASHFPVHGFRIRQHF